MKQSRDERARNPYRDLGRQHQSVTVAVFALVIVLVLVASYGILELTERRAHAAAEQLVSQVVAHIDEKMNEVSNVTRAAAQTVYPILDDPEALEAFTREFVSRNSFIYGSTVAFEPDAFPGRGRCFAPYSWVTPDNEIHSRQLGTETDYYEEEWYAETKRTGSEYWCEPYYDEGGAKIMMCTFSVPLKDGAGNLVAVLTADVGLDDLEAYISTINPYEDSFILLRSAKGNPLVEEPVDTTFGNDTILIRGLTGTGWSVELLLPFSILMRGDTGVFLCIGGILLVTVLFAFFVNRLLNRQRQRSSAEYMNVIGAISTGFSSIYLVDLVSGETVTVRDPESYEDIVGEDDENTEFTEKLTRLIRYDVYEADQEKMLGAISLDALRTGLGSRTRYQVRFRKERDGELRWFEMHVFDMERNADGTPSRAVVAFIDVNETVTKEMQAQDTLEKALVMAQSANKAKTDFLFSMSHDIRTPLNAILGFTGMAKKHIDDKEKTLDCLEKTQQSGSLLLALINSVLEVSRIESGHAELRESPADVFLSFSAIADTLIDLAATKDIALSFEIGTVQDRYVYCDLDRCNRIFVNIISNSIKYTNEGGRIEVRCDQIASDRPGYGNYRYLFRDNGIGMSEEFQKRVFEHFSREETSTISGVQGSGLGMAVCKSFVDLMGGSIECQSVLGEGTVFIVELPFRIQEGQKYIDPFTREEVTGAYVERENSAPATVRGKRVLLVEDNELNREIAEEMLADEGMTVETAENGAVAVRALQEKGAAYYDFILMDIQMPVMNGYEATKAIRSMYPETHIPIIAVSANAFEEDREASRAAGMDAHVAKPINVSELLTALARFL